jgi:hypothetical protein
VVVVTPRPRFSSGKGHPITIGEEAGWTSTLFFIHRLKEKSFAYAENGAPVVQSVIRHSIK